MAEDFGICGPDNRSCKISHSSTFPNQVGIYPSEFLPSTSTIWHATFASQFPAQFITANIGLDLLGAGLPASQFVPISPQFHRFQSHHYIIFAQTANRVNVAHTVTQAEIDSGFDNGGVVTIDVGEFVFEFLSVTDQPIKADLDLTEAEIAALQEEELCTGNCSSESEEDRKFRKLFETPLVNENGEALTNRFINIEPNSLGIEYRLDNGSGKSRQALDQSGLGDVDNASIRDGSSRKITVQLLNFQVDDDGNTTNIDENNPEDGTVIYLTYVAVKEHYLRQRISVVWQVIDPGTAEFASECISQPVNFNISHYRFFEWDMEPESGQEGQPSKLSGWRVTETFKSNVNFVAPVDVGNNDTTLGDFAVGRLDIPTISVTDFLEAKSKPSEVQAFINERNSTDRFTFQSNHRLQVSLTELTGNGAYHVNTSGNIFKEAPWFQRGQFTRYDDAVEASEHVFYNVHQRALKKRDVDKWGIERFLAEQLEQGIRSGEDTNFPFMDDSDVDDPTSRANESLDASNTLFLPVQPTTSYGGNFFTTCGSIGSFPTSINITDDINSYHSFSSNIIKERFDEGTRVLVERNFAVGAGPLGANLITIEGVGGGGKGSITCLADPSREYGFASHTNDDKFLVYNLFSNGRVEEAVRKLAYRPDEVSPPFKNNDSPTVDQFEPLVGISGMIGDLPGVQPGRAVAIASCANSESFITTEIDFTLDTNLTMPIDNGYHGSLVINYTLAEGSGKDEDAFLLAKIGSQIVGVIDGLVVRSAAKSLRINFQWMRASSFELVGLRVADMIISTVVATSINEDQVNDFLNEESSHDLAYASGSLTDKLTNRSIFFTTDILTMSEDEHSVLYIFFNDNDGGISAAASNDYGSEWHYHYGIVEKMAGINSLNPFAVTHFKGNSCFLFFQMNGKILVKKIPFSLFKLTDANMISRFERDVFQAADTASGTSAVENKTIYSNEGKILRRSVISYVAAGDLTDIQFLEALGQVPDSTNFEPTETREVEGSETTVRKNPMGRGSSTAFNNINVKDIFFSAYRRDNGELRLFYMADTADGPLLQCHFSTDDGQTWYDFWEFIQNRYNRMRFDPDKNTQFIDRSAAGDVIPSTKQGTDPLESGRDPEFGVNIHWSRLAKDKITEGELTADSESQVLGISAPYVFCQSTFDRIFLFYIYKNCLLCKVFGEDIFSNAITSKSGNVDDPVSGMALVKDVIEKQTRAYFIDGSLSSANIREELHSFADEANEEIVGSGNIIFRYPFAVDNFGDDRRISPQRVCAYSTPTGLVRVFYKHADSLNLKSALWTGREWWAEDFMRNSDNLLSLTLPNTSGFASTIGGLGGTGF